ncbi:hypothetical protein [Novipirellula artificiosorum]|uniref:Uncharacterized protein n=1 Tax=Novipirellula artificiosorum TaxID=2528016 RepID=A0A5C6E6E6_9BACT|nr:hypothetical protein [Novipirellula artificiosorum]TWU42749.1 hypothetical protein Poly41_10490 [Novipirellula artificiosorum]
MPKANEADQIEDQNIITMDRRSLDRRSGNPEAVDTGMMEKPRRKKQRRRHIDPTTCERDYNEQEIEFMRAMDDYKRAAGRMFPTCSEVLEVIRSLGYVQLTREQFEVLELDSEADEAYEAETDIEADLEEELADA